MGEKLREEGTNCDGDTFQQVNKVTQHNSTRPEEILYSEKNELPLQFEPTTLTYLISANLQVASSSVAGAHQGVPVALMEGAPRG